MDDLTILKGIGPAAAKKLVAAGIDSFAALAAATSEQLVSIDRLPGSPADWSAWREEAKSKAPATPARPLTDVELSELVASWDAARTEMRNAGEAVVQLQEKLEALAPDADHTVLDAEIENAKARVLAAEAAIAALTPLPEGVRLPDAAVKQNTTQSEADQEGGAGNVAGPTAELLPLDGVFLEELDRLCAEHQVDRAEVLAAARRWLVDAGVRKAAAAQSNTYEERLASVIEDEIDGVLASVRRAAEADLPTALAHLDQQTHEAEQMAAAATSIVTALAAERVRLSRSVECWPLELIRYDGEERPIGVSLMVEPTVFDQLFAAGAVSNEPPKEAPEAE
jgi:hypothetical protein